MGWELGGGRGTMEIVRWGGSRVLGVRVGGGGGGLGPGAWDGDRTYIGSSYYFWMRSLLVSIPA